MFTMKKTARVQYGRCTVSGCHPFPALQASIGTFTFRDRPRVDALRPFPLEVTLISTLIIYAMKAGSLAGLLEPVGIARGQPREGRSFPITRRIKMDQPIGTELHRSAVGGTRARSC
uniref:(northern house mosquito) hypothetical protein n=1 Tax=Culex pipiens TaxID=7175 RepID=A0A8D8IPI7_CULPI